MNDSIGLKSKCFSSSTKCCSCNHCPCVNVLYWSTLILKLENEWHSDIEGNLVTVDNKIVSNKAKRYFLYKQYILERYGVLGRGKQIKLPLCIESKIKETYPDPTGEYVGFIPRT